MRKIIFIFLLFFTFSCGKENSKFCNVNITFTKDDRQKSMDYSVNFENKSLDNLKSIKDTSILLTENSVLRMRFRANTPGIYFVKIEQSGSKVYHMVTDTIWHDFVIIN